ncbi:MAG: HEAT repeat domain-containing protein [Tepidisphaeraceae bacterium]
MPAQAGTQLINSKKAALKPAVVAIMIRAMAERNDVLGAPLLVELARGPEPVLQLAALDGLGDCGEGSVVAVLAEAAAKLQGPPQQAARNSLERMSAANVDTAILAALSGAEPKVKQEYCRALGARRAVSAVPVLLDMAGKDADQAVCADAIKAVGSLGGIKDVDALLAILIAPKSDAEGKSAEEAISGIISRVHDADQRATPLLAAIDKAGKAKASILQLLGRTGSDKAVAVLRAASKDADKEMQTAAIRAMGEWPSDGMADDLHALALASKDQTQQVLAIRGFNKALSYQNTRKSADVVKLYGELLPVARPDERKGILSGLSNISTIESFKLVAGQLDAPGTQNEAMNACVKIGRDIVGKYPQEVGPVAKKIRDTTKDERVKGTATEILDRVK